MTIVRTQGTCGGQPRIDGHRITVIDILRYLSSNMTIDEICEEFDLTKYEVIGAINWSAEYIDEQF